MIDLLNIGSLVFTKIKYLFSADVKTKYSMTDANFTKTNKAYANPVFPIVYVHELPGVEIGTDLDGSNINAMMATIQVDVIDGESQTNAQEVMAEIVRIMKIMRFEISSMPNFDNEDSNYRSTARFRRTIGNGDTL